MITPFCSLLFFFFNNKKKDQNSTKAFFDTTCQESFLVCAWFVVATESMKAIVVSRFGDPSVLEYKDDAPTPPPPGPGQVCNITIIIIHSIILVIS